MDLRKELCEPFGGLRTETLDELEAIVQKYAEHYHNLQLHKTQVSGSFSNSIWTTIDESMPPNNVSCLCLRNSKRICNLYFDGKNWMDDGFDSKGERIFTDVTHWVRLENIPLP